MSLPRKQLFLAFSAMLVTTTSAAADKISSSDAVGIAISQIADHQVISDHQAKDYDAVMILATLNGASKMATNTGRVMTAVDYVTLANKAQTWLEQRAPEKQTFINKSQADAFKLMIDSFSSFASEVVPIAGPPLTTYFGGLTKQKVEQLESALNPARQAAASVEFTDRELQAKQFAGRNAQEAYALALNDPQFAVAVDPLLRTLTGLDSTSTYDTAKQLYPAIIRPLSQNDDGSFNVDTNDLLNQYTSLLTSVRAGTGVDIADLNTISAYQLASVFPVDPATNPSPLPPGNTDNPDQRQKNQQLVLDAAQSSINGISKLIGLSNPQLAQQVSTVGGATVQVGAAISKYLHTTETMTSTARGLAGAALAGDVIGAAVDIFSLFGGGASVDGGVAGQIAALSKQIEDLRQDMDNRFDRVDASLNSILRTLHDNFGQINYTLGTLAGNVTDIQNGLFDLQTNLNRFERYSLAWLTTISKEQLVLTMNGCLRYRARTGADIGYAQYASCETAFYTWANNNARDELWAGLAQPDYTDGNIYQSLSNFPFSVDINYLAQFPAQNLGLSPLTTKRLANPNEWALGARAYLQLAGEWPQYAGQISSTRIDDLVQVGTTLRAAVQNITGLSSNGVLSPNRALWKALIDKYNGAVASLQTALQSFVSNYVSDPKLLLAGLDLWGGATQKTSLVPAATRIPAWCDGTAIFSGLTIPSGNMFSEKYLSAQNSAPFLLAEHFGLGTIDYCVEAWFENGSNVRNGSGVADVAIYGRINGIRVARWYKRLTVWEANSGSNQQNRFRAGTDLYNYVPNNWNVCQYTDVCIASPCPYRAQFEGSATNCGGPINPVVSVYPYDPTTTLNTINQVNSVLRDRQRALYAQISTAFTSATAIQVAGQRVNAMKLSLQAYASLGLLGPINANDYLRSLFYGDQGILDGPGIQIYFASFSASAIPDTTVNGITAESLTMNYRAAALLPRAWIHEPGRLPVAEHLDADLASARNPRRDGVDARRGQSARGNLAGPLRWRAPRPARCGAGLV